MLLLLLLMLLHFLWPSILLPRHWCRSYCVSGSWFNRYCYCGYQAVGISFDDKCAVNKAIVKSMRTVLPSLGLRARLLIVHKENISCWYTLTCLQEICMFRGQQSMSPTFVDHRSWEVSVCHALAVFRVNEVLIERVQISMATIKQGNRWKASVAIPRYRFGQGWLLLKVISTQASLTRSVLQPL